MQDMWLSFFLCIIISYEWLFHSMLLVILSNNLTGHCKKIEKIMCLTIAMIRIMTHNSNDITIMNVMLYKYL